MNVNKHFEITHRNYCEKYYFTQGSNLDLTTFQETYQFDHQIYVKNIYTIKIERSMLAIAVDKVRLHTCDISLKGITLTAYSTKLPLKHSLCLHLCNISKTCTISEGLGGSPHGSSSLRLPYFREEKL